VTEIKTRSLGWMNGRLVPFDESYTDNLKKSGEFGHFIDEMHETITHYISNIPYKGVNLRNEILLEQNLMTREKRMNFIYNYVKSPIVPKIESYVRSFNSDQQFELLKKGKVGDYLPPREQKKINERLLQIKEIKNSKERLKDLYFLWIELYEKFFLNGCFDYPLGKKLPGDILSEEVEKLEGKINRVYKNPENSVFDLLHDPKIKAYEIELNLDTLDFLSSLTKKTGSDIEIMQNLQKKIAHPDIAEKLFIYSKKHFDGSIIRTLNELVKIPYQNIKPRGFLKKMRERENELAINYSSTMKKLFRIDKSNNESKKHIMKSLEKIKFLMYNDFYIQSKLLNIPDRKDSLCFTWLTVDQQLKEYIRQIDPRIEEKNLSDFVELDTNVRSILKIDMSVYDKIWEKVRKGFELEVGG
jgi:hypothetical protein